MKKFSFSSIIRSSRAGFTLIELLMVAMLIPLIAFAVYANFNSGIKIWTRLHHQTGLEDLRLFSLKVSNSFESALRYSSISFEGDKESVSFAALIQTDEKLGGDRGIGRIRFYYDPGTQSIQREKKNLSQIYKEKEGRSETLLHGVSAWKVSFFALDKQGKTYQWMEVWEDRPKELPAAVRFEFLFSGASGARPVTKTFMIPAGGSIEKN